MKRELRVNQKQIENNKKKKPSNSQQIGILTR